MCWIGFPVPSDYSLFNDHGQDKYRILRWMRVIVLISYAPFWETLKQSKESTYTLITRHHLSSSTLDKLRKNKPLTTTTINDLCRILGCSVEQIMKYVPSELDQKL